MSSIQASIRNATIKITHNFKAGFIIIENPAFIFDIIYTCFLKTFPVQKYLISALNFDRI